MQKSAVITGPYRYHLERIWDPTGPRLGVIMVNPSTADAENDDPTIRLLVEIAKLWGYGSISVGNLFAYRTPKPTVLKEAINKGVDVVGPENDIWLKRIADQCDTLLAAWGHNGQLLRRDRAVLDMLRDSKFVVIGFGGTGYPWHPLALSYNNLPIPNDPIPWTT